MTPPNALQQSLRISVESIQLAPHNCLCARNLIIFKGAQQTPEMIEPVEMKASIVSILYMFMKVEKKI